MPPRRRKPENSDLPPNLYCYTKNDVAYYYFEHPGNHERDPLGTDREAAIRTVRAINTALGSAARAPKAQDGMTIARVAAEWLPKRLEKLRGHSSRRNAKWHLDRFGAHFPRHTLRQITTRQISDWLDSMPLSYRNKARVEIIKLIDFALARGYLPHTYGNPAAVTEYTSEPPAARLRLGLADYRKIHAAAPAWLQTLMDIMLQTTLRPGDALRLRFDQFYDGALHTQVRKSLKYLAIELDHEEQQIIRRARLSGIASPYIVHRMPLRKRRMASGKDHPTQITGDMASREFARVRDELGIAADVDVALRPPLYEVRSLASWLYEQAGRDRGDVAALMAHTSEQMTAHYQDDRRVNFVRVRAGLCLSAIREIQ